MASAMTFPIMGWANSKRLETSNRSNWGSYGSRLVRTFNNAVVAVPRIPCPAVSSSPRLARPTEHRHWSQKLQVRAHALSDALRAEKLPGVPWQGGFFVTLQAPDPQGLATKLRERGIFVVPMAEGLRVGVCGLKAADAPIFALAYRECQ